MSKTRKLTVILALSFSLVSVYCESPLSSKSLDIDSPNISLNFSFIFRDKGILFSIDFSFFII
ncbi:MAG: hypothetical protein BWY21_02086 [Parcubacteria group bacterium ADurb.Bin216]|nr:MAG: hypothetical protein BWY21_02086 [Parcubacteria group bacterium ADurb.Bin216]